MRIPRKEGVSKKKYSDGWPKYTEIIRIGRGKRKPKMSAYKFAIKQTEVIVNAYVRLRDKKRYGGLCYACRKNYIYSANHFISAQNLSTRFEEDNIFGGCRGCNYSEMIDRRSRSKARWRDLHVAMVGEARVKELEALALKPGFKLDRAQLADIRAHYRKKMEAILL